MLHAKHIGLRLISNITLTTAASSDITANESLLLCYRTKTSLQLYEDVKVFFILGRTDRGGSSEG